MEISIHSLLEGATRATGSVAVIDVFRAFTSAAVALANGASKIVMVARSKRHWSLGKLGSARSASPGGRDWLLRSQAWVRFMAEPPMASISETRHSKSRQSPKALRSSQVSGQTSLVRPSDRVEAAT